ncbi:MAG: NAD(P)/FAD-dependent oxidoreductase, partial [Bryobacteraceae bacterium]
KGWFWYIPLPEDVVSVGVVAEKDYLYSDGKDLKTIFHREVAKNPWVESHLAVGQQFGPYRVTGEYSYRSRFCATDGLLLVGDAFGFLDPVFSSGVFLALRSGEMAADVVDEALAAGDYSGSRFEEYGRQLCNGIESMRQLVYAFYDLNFSFRGFFDVYPDFRGEVTDCLMGDLFKNFQPLFDAVSEFAKVPPSLPHGRKAAPALLEVGR